MNELRYNHKFFKQGIKASQLSFASINIKYKHQLLQRISSICTPIKDDENVHTQSNFENNYTIQQHPYDPIKKR